MVKGRPLFPGSSDLDQCHKIFKCVHANALMSFSVERSIYLRLCGSPTEETMPGWKRLAGCDGLNTWDYYPRLLAAEFLETV